LVTPSASVLNPAGGHFGDGEGVTLDTFFFFFTGGFFFKGGFLVGAFFVGLAFGVGVAFFVAVAFGVGVAFFVAVAFGVGLFVAATADVTVIVNTKARASASAIFFELIISVDPI
jgi:hypothetical protein